MKRVLAIAFAFGVFTAALMSARSASAQALGVDGLTPALPTAGERKAADIASYAAVGVDVLFDTKAAWDAPNRSQALFYEGVRLGVTYAATQGIKMLIHRDRPCSPSCGIDAPNESFPSMHTALAFSTLGGPRLAISLPFAVGTGGLRIMANKHYLTDVLAGAAIGAAVSRIRP